MDNKKIKEKRMRNKSENGQRIRFSIFGQFSPVFWMWGFPIL